jgi:hypothetical protein
MMSILENESCPCLIWFDANLHDAGVFSGLKTRIFPSHFGTQNQWILL